MRFLTNRIVISLAVLVVLAWTWEFQVKPESGPVYTQAVNEYNAGNYQRSLELLDSAWYVNRGNANIYSLMGWNYLKLNNPQAAEARFGYAYELEPDTEDIILGLAYAKLALGKEEEAQPLLDKLGGSASQTSDVHIARGTMLRNLGQNLQAAREFHLALARKPDEAVALKNLSEIYDASGDVGSLPQDFPPLVRRAELTYTVRVDGDYFAVQQGDSWRRVYLKGVNLTPTMPGQYPSQPGTEPGLYGDWLRRIREMGANSVRTSALLPPGFYRALQETNSRAPESALYLVQSIAFAEPPESNLFDPAFLETCQGQIRAAVDAIHGQGDVAPTPLHAGGVYMADVSPWVAGFVVGRTWPSYIVAANDGRNAGQTRYQGQYLEVPRGTPTEVFLAQMLDYLLSYEQEKYNWQHPVAFLNWPTLDPMNHPTESTLVEEVRIRRAQGERVVTPAGPYANDDEATVDPNRLRPRPTLPAGYFAAYNIVPFYPDFLNHEPQYQAVNDAEGRNPFLGYVRDLKRNHRGLPLLVTEFGIPTSLGIGHFNPTGFNEGGLTEVQQGRVLARFARNLYDAGAAGGLVFEWLNQWYRTSWIVRNYETPIERSAFWTSIMDPSEHFGLLAVDTHLAAIHNLSGTAEAWPGPEPIYREGERKLFQARGDRFDAARDLKALSADADAAYLYLRLAVDRLDNDVDGQPDWGEVNYLIGVSTWPGKAGLVYLPFVSPVRFPMGMTYAIHLAGPQFSRILVSSTYNPFVMNQVPGMPAQTEIGPKLGWDPTLAEKGSYEAQIIEPNRRRFGRDGRYFPPQRYERGILRHGSLDPQSPAYDSLATWQANVETNTIDLRIPWNLLGVTDPSSHLVFAGLLGDGTVKTAETPGFNLVALSFRPSSAALVRPMMEQGHAIADALPDLKSATEIDPESLRLFQWEGWDRPRYRLRIKESYTILRQAYERLPATPGVR